jgi:hypothetical protein
VHTEEDDMGFIDWFKEKRDFAEALEVTRTLCADEIVRPIIKNNITEQMLQFATQMGTSSDIAILPYDISAVSQIGSQALAASMNCSTMDIVLAVCKDQKIIFVNYKQVYTLIKSGLIDPRLDDWGDVVATLYDAGLRLGFLNNLSGKLRIFKKIRQIDQFDLKLDVELRRWLSKKH